MEVAAAYLFYICKNHPFRDGNKRTAMMAPIVFLRFNEIEPKPDSHEWEKPTVDVASSKVARDQATRRLRKLLREPPGPVVIISSCVKPRGCTFASRDGHPVTA